MEIVEGGVFDSDTGLVMVGLVVAAVFPGSIVVVFVNSVETIVAGFDVG